MVQGRQDRFARTEAEAREKFDYMQSLIHTSVGIAVLDPRSAFSNLSRYPLDGPAPEMGDTNGPTIEPAPGAGSSADH
jgi:hypothetical protein